MDRVNNYLVQAQQAKSIFLRYDQNVLIEKIKLQADETFVYVKLLCKMYRLHRTTGDLERMEETWVDANTHGEVMTILDLVCDSRLDRCLSGRWKGMTHFGKLFHAGLLESRDAFADAIEKDREGFSKACEAMGGQPFPQGDAAYAIELFDGLSILVQLWFGEEEFPAALRFLWDANALMYLKYETMHFAKGLLLDRIAERM
jgi:hypothetical protein